MVITVIFASVVHAPVESIVDMVYPILKSQLSALYYFIKSSLKKSSSIQIPISNAAV